MADQPKPRKKQNIVVKDFGGINTKADRTAIKETEFAWLENVMPIGHGQLRWIPGISASTTTFASAVVYEQFVDILNIPYVVMILANGSAIARRIDTNSTVNVAVAGSFTVSGNTTPVQITQWQNTQALFIDSGKGYSSWDGTTWTLNDAALKGTSIAVFSGRVWFSLARTVYYSAPSSFTNFATAGAGNIVLVDSTLVSDITQLITANNFLYVFGDSSINVFSDVRVVSGTTVFTNTNISASVGTDLPNAIIPFARSLLIMNRYGVHALVGSTTNKISDELDGIFRSIDFTAPVIAGLILINNIQCAMFKFLYNDPTLGPRSIACVFFDKKWFVISMQSITWMTSVIYRGESLVYATNGIDFVQVAGDEAVPVAAVIVSALWSEGNPLTDKMALKVGIESQSLSATYTVTVDTPNNSAPAALLSDSSLKWINASGASLSWINAAGHAILWNSNGYGLLKSVANMMGSKYIGMTVKATATDTIVGALMMQIEEGVDW
jgi:hypothetical protein